MNDNVYELSPQLISNAYEANQRAFWMLFRQHPQFTFHDTGCVTWFETDIPHILFNRILQARGTVQMLSSTLDPIIGSLQQRNWPFLWHVGPSSYSDELTFLLKRYGLIHIEANPMMAVEVHKANETGREEKMTILPVTTAAQVEQWLRIVEFGTSDGIISQWLTFYSSLHLTLHSPLRLYLGFLGDQPVSTCALFFAAGVASLNFVATLRSHRRQGLATTMTVMALQEVRNHQHQICVLTASPMGRGIYHRVGFQLCGTVNIYRWSCAS